MRVLHLTLSAARGGRRDAILTLIDHLRPLGAECGLVALRNPEPEVAEFADRADFVGGLSFAARPTRAELSQVRRICRERQVAVIHAHDHGSQYVASALRLTNPRVRTVMTFHRSLGIETEGARNFLRNAISLPLIDRVLTASDDRRKYFIANTLVRKSKVAVIPIGIDLTHFRPDPGVRHRLRESLGIGDEPLALIIGHFGPEKGVDLALQAATAAEGFLGNSPWNVAVLGTGAPDRTAALEEQARATLGTRVRFHGFQSNVVPWLQGADLLIHTPRLEAFGLVVVQAMACGLPVVASSVGAMPELIDHGRTGILVPPDDIERLGREVARLVRDGDERRRLGERGFARAMQFYDARHYARRHVALYRALVPDH
ncbi:MAG TPA: glycosyltransferase family 4 protein [Gemmatimonadales bacterium]|jgi:glycosyltransferase involved in cell wall biosynthesis